MRENPNYKPDWRLVKVSFKRYCDESFVAEKAIEDCGVFVLTDANLHVHICSFTPSLEAWTMIPYATFTKEHDDDGETATEVEQAMTQHEPDVEYYGTDLLDLPNQPVTNIPEQEEGEPDEKYRARVADEVREHLQGNPCWF